MSLNKSSVLQFMGNSCDKSPSHCYIERKTFGTLLQWFPFVAVGTMEYKSSTK